MITNFRGLAKLARGLGYHPLHPGLSLGNPNSLPPPSQGRTPDVSVHRLYKKKVNFFFD